MKTKLIVLWGLLFMLAPPVPAQRSVAPPTPAGDTPPEGLHSGAFERNRFLDNWYIEAGGGIQLLFSDDASLLGTKERITPAVSLSLGKWFSPFWGVRLQAQGYSLHGFTNIKGNFIADPLQGFGGAYGPNDPVRDAVTINPDGSYRHYIRYVNTHADVRVSLANLIGGFNEKRRWDVIPAVGVGYVRVLPYRGIPAANAISSNFSLMGKYRLLERLDVNLEVNTALLPERFDGRISGGKSYEQPLAVTMGVTWRLGKKRIKPLACTYYSELVTARETVAKVEEQAKQYKAAAEAPAREVVREVIKEVPVCKEFVLAPLRFRIGRYEVTAEEHEPDLANIAAYLRENPKATLVLKGYADRQTGTSQYNRSLAGKRANAVADCLAGKYGISRDRLKTESYGDSEQPYETNGWNRIVNVTVIYE